MEIIEMGEVFDDDDFIGEDFGGNAGEGFNSDWEDRPYGSEEAATHVEVDGEQVPLDCQQLNDQWSVLGGVEGLCSPLANARRKASRSLPRKSRLKGLTGRKNFLRDEIQREPSSVIPPAGTTQCR